MTKKSTKKIKEVLKDLPTMKTSDDFMEKLHGRINNDLDTDGLILEPESDRPRWDEVEFSNGDEVFIGNNIYARPWTWRVWMGLLWVILSMPLWLGIMNSINSNSDEYYLVPAPIENGEVMPNTFETPVGTSSAGELESIEEWFGDLPFIWEDNALSFGEAFNLARTYLGPNDVFMWRGNKYTTTYAEEVVLYNN